VSGTNNIEIKLSIVVTTSTGIVTKWKLLQDATSLGEMAAYLNYDGAEPKILTFIWSATNVAASSTVILATLPVLISHLFFEVYFMALPPSPPVGNISLSSL
jgi:hypothetical protein